MRKISLSGLWLTACLLESAAGCANDRVPPEALPCYSEDFETSPPLARWTSVGPGVRGETLFWSRESDRAERGFLEIRVPSRKARDAGCESPPFPVRAGAHYALRFQSRSSAPALVGILFYDLEGALLEGDHYSLVETSPEWTLNELCFKAKQRASTASIVFRAPEEGSVAVDDLRVDPASLREVKAWSDRLHAVMPPLRYDPPQGTGRFLPRTAARLRSRAPLRAVLLGDSIANDLSNSCLEAMLADEFPGLDVDLRFTGRGGTGWTRHALQVRERILNHESGLVLFLAISNAPDTLFDRLGGIIDEVRLRSPATEMLIVTPHLKGWGGIEDAGLRHRELLIRLADERGVELVDLTSAWGRYLGEAGKDKGWLLRDAVHMNERGRQVAARVVLAHLREAVRRNP